MIKRLVFLLLLGSCAGATDTPPDPALRDVKVRLDFTEREVTITQGQFEIAGGKLTATGKVEYPNRANAMIDVAFKAKDVLVARDENLLVRTNADVKISGPFATALVSGGLLAIATS